MQRVCITAFQSDLEHGLFQDGARGELAPGIGWSLLFSFFNVVLRASGETLIRGLVVLKPVT